jgi:hypothetical protein
MNPFQPGSGSAGARGGMGRGRANRFGSINPGGQTSNPDSLFQLNGNLSRDPSAGMNHYRGTPAPALTSFNPMVRSSFTLPVANSLGSLRFTYRYALAPGAAGAAGEFERPQAAGLFTTTNLGNGFLLTAGTSFGASSAAGGARNSLTPSVSSGSQSHSALPLASVKLSF